MVLKFVGIGSLLLVTSCYFLSHGPDPNFPKGRVDGIFFENPSHGFIQVLESPRAVYETTDGGMKWKKFESGVVGFRRGRSFADAHKGWSIDEDNRDHSKIFQTEDGGLSWRKVFSTLNEDDFVFGGIQAISETEAWAVGITGAYHTNDGGKIWNKQGPSGTSLQFLNDQRGWINGDKLWQTADGGRDWTGVVHDGKSCFGGLGIFFLDETHAWAVGGRTEGNMEGGTRTGLITYTTNGGKTCKAGPQIPNQYFWSVFFLNEQEGWVGGIGSVLKTEDGGRTWVDSLGR